jgi:hypothetical protein
MIVDVSISCGLNGAQVARVDIDNPDPPAEGWIFAFDPDGFAEVLQRVPRLPEPTLTIDMDGFVLMER